MWVESLGGSILLGKLRGGTLFNLLDTYIEKWWLLTGAAALETTAAWIRLKEINPLWHYVDQSIWLIHLISYGMLLYVLWNNRQAPGFKYIFIGVLLNFMVIMANGGQMPVDITGIEGIGYSEKLEALKTGKDLVHRVMDPSTRLSFLGDVIHLRNPYPFPKTLSVGDVFMMAGVFLFIQKKMLDKNR